MPLIPRIVSANTKAPPRCSALPDSACARPSTDQAASLPVAPRQPFQKAPTRKPQRRTHFQNPPFPLNKNVPPQIHEAPLRQGLPGKRHLRNHLSVIGRIGASPAKRDCPQGCPLACLLSSRPKEARSVSGLSVSSWRPDSALPTVHLFQVPSSDPEASSLSCRRADKPGHCLAVVESLETKRDGNVRLQGQQVQLPFTASLRHHQLPSLVSLPSSPRTEAFRVILPPKCLLPQSP